MDPSSKVKGGDFNNIRMPPPRKKLAWIVSRELTRKKMKTVHEQAQNNRQKTAKNSTAVEGAKTTRGVQDAGQFWCAVA